MNGMAKFFLLAVIDSAPTRSAGPNEPGGHARGKHGGHLQREDNLLSAFVTSWQ